MRSSTKLIEQATRDIIADGPYMGDENSIYNQQYRQVMAAAEAPTIFVGIKKSALSAEQLGGITNVIEINAVGDVLPTIKNNPRCDLIVFPIALLPAMRELGPLPQGVAVDEHGQLQQIHNVAPR